MDNKNLSLKGRLVWLYILQLAKILCHFKFVMKIVFLIDVSEYVLHKFSSLKIQVCVNLMRDILIPLVQLIMHLYSLMELLIVENGWQLQGYSSNK